MPVCCFVCEVQGVPIPIKVMEGVLQLRLKQIRDMSSAFRKCCEGNISASKIKELRDAATRVLEAPGQRFAMMIHPRFYQAQLLRLSNLYNFSTPIGSIFEILDVDPSPQRRKDRVMEKARDLISQSVIIFEGMGNGQMDGLGIIPLYCSVYIDLPGRNLEVISCEHDGNLYTQPNSLDYSELENVMIEIKMMLLVLQNYSRVSLILINLPPITLGNCDIQKWIELFSGIYGSLNDKWIGFFLNHRTKSENAAMLRVDKANRNVQHEYILLGNDAVA